MFGAVGCRMSRATRAYAKAAGTARRAVSALSGKVGILNTLEGEHQEVSILVDRVIACARAGEDGDARELLDVVRRELVDHGEAERAEFYGRLEEVERCRPWIEHAEATHDEIGELLDALVALPACDPQWLGLAVALRDALDDHIDDEEGELFEIAREALTGNELREMGERYESRRRGAMSYFDHVEGSDEAAQTSE
jgi:hypothetical protein